MNIFVLSTGRCGSVTLLHACKHITNYTVAHESKRGVVGHLGFPNQHIEIDPHLVFNIGTLRKMYPDAIYVHQKRNKEDCTESLAKRGSMRNLWIPHAYQKRAGNVDVIDIHIAAGLFYDFFNDTIAEFFPNAIQMNLENAKKDFYHFWHFIGAEGNLEVALNEFNIFYNKGT